MKKIRLLAYIAALVSLVACGGSATPQLGDFPNLSKTEGDASFVLAAPTSKSPAPFVFTSSNPATATIAGNTVTVLLAGTTTITASQSEQGTWSGASTSALLTVAAIKCTDGFESVGGKCVAPCVTPATRVAGVCIATSAASAKPVVLAGKTWMPVAFTDIWAKAKGFCEGTTINGQAGWRLPNAFDTDELFKSGQMNGQGWVLSKVWTSSAGTNSAGVPFGHVVTDLSTGASGSAADDAGAYVSCIR